MSRVSKKLSKAVKIARTTSMVELTKANNNSPRQCAKSTAHKAVVAVAQGKEPWDCCPDVWKTKAAFFAWMRGQMRRAWSRHPVKVSYMHNHRERVPLGRKTAKNPTGLVWGCRCEHCNQLFKQVECEVDHIEAAGSFKGWEDFEAWMIKLMHINWDSIRVVCKECHRIISYAERTGMTFEEAKLEKEAIAFSKLSVVKQCDILELALGYDKAARASNAKLRRTLFTKHLQEKL
jgi:hypothetical protein